MGQDLILSSKFVKLHKKLHLLYNCITLIVLKIVFMIMYLPVDAGMYKIQNLLSKATQQVYSFIPTTPVEVCSYKMYNITRIFFMITIGV